MYRFIDVLSLSHDSFFLGFSLKMNNFFYNASVLFVKSGWPLIWSMTKIDFLQQSQRADYLFRFFIDLNPNMTI